MPATQTLNTQENSCAAAAGKAPILFAEMPPGIQPECAIRGHQDTEDEGNNFGNPWDKAK